jgi:hypothetical protein
MFVALLVPFILSVRSSCSESKLHCHEVSVSDDVGHVWARGHVCTVLMCYFIVAHEDKNVRGESRTASFVVGSRRVD